MGYNYIIFIFYDRKSKRKSVLEIFEIGADLEPLCGVTGNIIRAKKSGDDGGDPSPVLGKPISLEDAADRLRMLSRRLFRGNHGDLSEIGQCEGVDRRLLRVKVRRDQAVHLRASDHTH